MEELEPEEVFADLLRIQREQQLYPAQILMTHAVDVPLLPRVLAQMYFKSQTRVLTRMHANTLTHAKCYCVEPVRQCVCNRAAWFIIRCWFMQAERGEVWRVAQRLAGAYRVECLVAHEKKLPFYYLTRTCVALHTPTFIHDIRTRRVQKQPPRHAVRCARVFGKRSA
jgi:hypothetical protein